MSVQAFDVVVVGGGIDGVAVARDCAMRGLSVLLLEKHDFGRGASGCKTGILNGGQAWMQSDRSYARQLCEEIGILRRIAPNICHPLTLIHPIRKSEGFLSRNRLESQMRSYQKLKGQPLPLRLRSPAVRELGSGLDAPLFGALKQEEWASDPQRLIVLNAKSAKLYGAQIWNKAALEKIVTEKKAVVGAEVRLSNGTNKFIKTKVVANLSGAWSVGLFRHWLPQRRLQLYRRVYYLLDRRLFDFGIVFRSHRRGEVILLPHHHLAYMGPSENEYYGSPENPYCNFDDLGFIRWTIQRYFPNLNPNRIIRPVVGVHAKQVGKDSGQLPMDHSEFGADGLFTCLGGTLAGYRQRAELLTNRICKKLRRKERCRTHVESLPGCTTDLPWQEESKRSGLDPRMVKKLMARYGYEAHEIIAQALRHPPLKETLCPCERIIAAEVDHAIRNEWASEYEDVCRRTSFRFGACQSSACRTRILKFMAKSLGWTASKSQEKERESLQSPSLPAESFPSM